MAQYAFQGPAIDDNEILSLLPSEYGEFLQTTNGCIFPDSWIHIRGACRYPTWHSIRTAATGARSIRASFPSLRPDDCPFGQDAFGNQFVLRGGHVFRLDGETGKLTPLDLPFSEFPDRAHSEPARLTNYEFVRHFFNRGLFIEPGELLNISPPLIGHAQVEHTSFRPVAVEDQLMWLSQLSASVLNALGDEVSLPERPLPSRSAYLDRIAGLVEFSPPIEDFREQRATKPVTILAGPNNMGKSLLMKWLKARTGATAYFLAVNRFYHVHQFSTGLRDPLQGYNLNRQFVQTFWQEQQNTEQNLIDLNQIVIGLNNDNRDRLLRICGEMLGCSLALKSIDPSNDLSPRYIEMDGQNVALGSTGTRLLLTLLGICMDDRFSTVLIDEPELGLSPNVQRRLAALLLDKDVRKTELPHLERVIIASHSHLFLDRNDFTNNFIVSKSGMSVSIQAVASIPMFHRLQFNLLGNTLEAMFLPSLIIVTEGPTDLAYLDRLLAIRYPSMRVAVMQSEGNVKAKVHSLRGAMGELEKSAYADRLLIVLDQMHQFALSDELVRLGVRRENIIVWKGNGIEYCYPRDILREVFASNDEQLGEIAITGDIVELNGISRRKMELSAEVLKRLAVDSELPAELTDKLLARIEAITSPG